MVVYRKSDRIKLKVGELEVHLAPMTFMEKSTVQDMVMENAMKGSMHALKCAVKNIKGLTLNDGSEYELQFENDLLTDECIDDLTNIQNIDELFIACLDLLNGVPSEFRNPVTGEVLQGIEIIKEQSGETPEKKSGS